MSFAKSNFFVVSRDDDLSKVQSKIYGFQIHHGVDDVGHFVKISASKEWINVSVDPYGMGILFLYQDDDYWAVSNSFYLLSEYVVRLNKKLTVNKDYLNLFAKVNAITTVSYSETLFNEITVVPSNRELRIFKQTKGLTYKNYKEKDHFLMGSEASLDFIDKWANKWISIIRGLANSGNQINVQLSGGFDSRLVLAIVLASGIDLNTVNVESSKSMPEDLSIAEDIAKFYGFQVNNGILDNYRNSRISKESQYMMNLYYRGGVHKEFLPPTHYKFYDKPLFILAGYGNMRGWFNDTPERYISYLHRTKYIEKEDIAKSLDRIITKTVDDVYKRMNCGIPKGEKFMNFVYNYTRGRYNYGSSVMASATVNQFILSPILELACVNPISKELGEDFNLLFAYIYQRFAPDLLKFKFNNGRSISKETVEVAKRLNEIKPFEIKTKLDDFSFECQNNTKEKSLSLSSLDIRDRILNSFGTSEVAIINGYVGENYIDLAITEFNSKTRHNEKSLFCLHCLSQLIGKTLPKPADLIF